MCGIFGIITREQRTLGPTLIEAGRMLSYRGYDSVGSATIDQDGKIDLRKDVGKVDEDVLYAIKKGSGLVAGITDDSTVISSDLPSLLPLTRKIMRIEDGEIVILTHNSIELRSVADGSIIERHFEEVIETMEAAQKGSFPHFMLKEIHEQPTVARELLNLLDSSSEVDKIVARMKAADHVYLVGCGTSYHACMLGSVYFSRLAGKATTPVLAPQFIAQYGPAVGPNDVGMFVSQSGETKDVLNAIETAEARGMGVLGLVNVIGSTLMRVSEHHLPLACGYEISVPATKTFTNQVIAFLYLAMRMGGHDTSTLANLPDLMEETIHQTASQIEALEHKLTGIDDLYCLGYGLTYPIALEGALKLKEITYLHCEGMLSTEFKHGPLSAVEEGYPVLFVAGHEDVDLIISGINETTTRGGMAVVFGADNPRLEANGDVLVTFPRTDPNIEALLSVIPLQLLSYHMSLRLGFDPDFPRNLSKTLTVD